jgi:hypothetical protein
MKTIELVGGPADGRIVEVNGAETLGIPMRVTGPGYAEAIYKRREPDSRFYDYAETRYPEVDLR